MSNRITLSRFIIANERLLRAFSRIPGFHFCAGRLGARMLPLDYREWFQVRSGVGRGIWLKLNPRIGGQYYRGQADPDLQRILQQHLRPGMVFYDIGSNNGFFALLAARIVGVTGRVVAFEAEPRLATLLCENVEKNGARNLRVVRSAVWSSSGSVNFDPADLGVSPGLGTGKVVPDSTVHTVGVPSISLDDFVQTERPPDLIKCDVEGAEVEVFRGASSVLRERKPRVECEVHSEANGKLLRGMLEEGNYDVRWHSLNHFIAVPRDSFPRSAEETT